MTITYKKSKAVLSDVVSVEETEGLLEWLQAHPKGKLDLSGCVHLHTANLQVLMAARPSIAAWPQDAGLAAWLRAALNDEKKEL
jgi:alpha-D-ribose 1-methylphosphonate 5-triphosphate diphosphatase PhnM